MPKKPVIADFNREIFDLRLKRSHDDLFEMLERLYSRDRHYEQFLTALDGVMRKAFAERADDLKRLDLKRDLEPDWFQRSDVNGYVFYIDRFAGNLKGIAQKLPYLKDLAISYVHFMPCLKPRPGDSDGGYSVMDYRAVNPAYGTMADLEAATKLLRDNGISVCIDLVLNHTAKEHEWAVKAAAGEKAYQDYYLMFDDAAEPKAYERDLIEIFPEHAPGSFTHYPAFGKWVWTTFNEHQWDLNWANPQVFLEMAEVMLFLANKGVDVLRFDAVAFMWKRMGTRCQSEPEVHMLLQALRAVCRIVAPAVIHLEEAIVSPSEMLPYLGRGAHDGKEGNLAYHNSLMVQFWSALAARDTRLMTHVMKTHFPPVVTNATYATYLRCHDDIGWAVTDEDASAIGIGGRAHRAFLSDFYEGTFPGSFSRGALFQENSDTGDKRITGALASLAGLEQAEEDGDAGKIDRAIDRILMGHALIASYGGVPLIYMGDEIALTNDYGYTAVPEHAHDSRWLNRPMMDWARTEAASDTPAGRVRDGVRHILHRRRAVKALHGANPTIVIDTGNPRLFAFLRKAPAGPLLCLFNFSEEWTSIDSGLAAHHGVTRFHDLLSDADLQLHDGVIALPPYARVWLA
ncbi:amylosucrase [Rhizobium sp. RU20A]|uniref:amylosucrase n=1 Tax=Rhizobium sp. RU20A TaxID=1907412 RepID=UPI00095456ED|nr:amylosucrase [Rhizobium sp. RU20A]SIQ28016.1 amylosucrase [Rhizobium sp. RU20A]